MSYTTHIAVAAFLLGAVIAIRFTVMALIPCVLGIIAVAAMLVHDSLFDFVIAAGEGIACLEVGYLIASISHF